MIRINLMISHAEGTGFLMKFDDQEWEQQVCKNGVPSGCQYVSNSMNVISPSKDVADATHSLNQTRISRVLFYFLT